MAQQNGHRSETYRRRPHLHQPDSTNKAVKREVYPMPKVDDSIASVAGSRVFSPLDANSGFWQISLAEDSKESTTFITLFGRYCLNQLAFGTSSAPEIFSWMMAKLLRGIVSVIVHMYDKLIHGADIDSQRREGGTRHGVGM